MLKAWGRLQKLKREEAALAELPVAALQALTANINRDPKKGQPFTLQDFCLLGESQGKAEAVFSAKTAAVALSLRAENQLPALLLTAWPQLLASAKDKVNPPEVRALKSDDETVWVLAPTWEGKHVRGGLVAVKGQISGTVLLRDVDRPLARYKLQIPARAGFGWLEAGLLLLKET